jgi:outer membrane protein assembly factor BamE (lipoprotein component of BamABCDE complex)
MALFSPKIKKNFARKNMALRAVPGAALLSCGLILSACQNFKVDGPSDIIQQGYVIDQAALDATPVGSSREQVLLSLGTPSTINTLEGTEVFYYISQTRKRSIAYQKTRVTDQRVLAIYFGPDGTVTNIANYGLQDGKVFDFVKRVTPTGGKDLTFIQQILSGLGGAPKLGGPGNKGDVY